MCFDKSPFTVIVIVILQVSRLARAPEMPASAPSSKDLEASSSATPSFNVPRDRVFDVSLELEKVLFRDQVLDDLELLLAHPVVTEKPARPLELRAFELVAKLLRDLVVVLCCLHGCVGYEQILEGLGILRE